MLMNLSMTEKHACENTVAMETSRSLTNEMQYLFFSRSTLGKSSNLKFITLALLKLQGFKV